MKDLIPSFLKKIHARLLINKPNFWSTRFVLLVPAVLVSALVLALFFGVSHINLLHPSNKFTWTLVLALLAFVFIVIWLYFLLRFNVFKRFGKLNSLHYWTHFFIFLASFLCIVTLPIVPHFVESWQANRAFTSERIAKDMNQINSLIAELHKGEMPKEWNETHYFIVDKQDVRSAYNTTTDDGVQIRKEYVTREYIDQAFQQALTDSLVQQSKDFYIEYRSPDYSFIHETWPYSYSSVKSISDAELYLKFVRTELVMGEQRAAKEQKLKLLLNRYRYREGYRHRENYTDDWRQTIKVEYQLGQVEEGLDNMVSKKYTFHNDNWRWYMYAVLTISLVLALSLFLFRHNHNKVFFWSLLGAVILFFFSIILMVIFRGKLLMITGLLVLYYITFFLLALQINKAKKFNLFSAMALNYFTVFTAFMPFMLVLSYYQLKRERYYRLYSYGNSDLDNTIYDAWFSSEGFHTEASYWVGLVLVIILIQLLIGPLLKKSYAAPQI